MGMCYTYLQELLREKDEDENAGPGKAAAASRSKKLRSDPSFQAIMRELENQRSRGFSVHPKMDLLKTLVVQHFAESLADDDVEEHTNEETRAMVFVTFREAVDEIVEALNFERPLIRASKFIGQGTDKQGKKGLAQKEQLEVLMVNLNNPCSLLKSFLVGSQEI
jgi:ATP-dependent DNA helicase MPH1